MYILYRPTRTVHVTCMAWKSYVDCHGKYGMVSWYFFGLVKYRAPVPKLPRHLPLDGGSGPRLGMAWIYFRCDDSVMTVID